MSYDPGRKPVPGRTIDYDHHLLEGIVGWWMFNERGGLISHDLSGKGNHGTLTNGPTWVGNTLSYDGTNDYVLISENTSLAMGLTDFTISLWINYGSTQVSSYPRILTKGEVTTSVAGYTLRGDTSAPFLRIGDGVADKSVGVGVININTWYYITFTVDRGNVVMKSFLNGQYMAQISLATVVGDISNATAPTIGGYSIATRGFVGFIDNIRIYNRALSAVEIAQLYENTLSGRYAEFPKVGVKYFIIGGGVTSKSISASLILAPTLNRTTNKGISTNTILAPTINKVTNKIIEPSFELIASLNRIINKGISANTPIVTDVNRIINKGISANTTLSVSNNRVISKVISVSSTIVTSVNRVISKGVSSSFTLGVSIASAISGIFYKTISAAVTLSPSVGRTIHKGVSSSFSLVPSIGRIISKGISSSFSLLVTVAGIKETIRLLWEWVDIFLGRLRSIQRFYYVEPDYWLIQLYDYCYINDNIVFTLGTQPEDEE